MSRKSHWKLTENGVLALYEETFKNEVTVQVIFMSQIDSLCYLRVSDGQHLSPVVFMVNEVMTRFSVGAVIIIRERKMVPYDEYSEHGKFQLYLEDSAIHHIFIERLYLVADHDEVGCVLGSLDRSLTYRDNINNVLDVMKEWYSEEDQLRWEFNGVQSHMDRLEGVRLREQGNTFFEKESYAEAITYYDMAKVKDPYDCRVWFNCSIAHYRLEEYMFAELHALVAMKIHPFYEKAYYRAGKAALKDRRRAMGEMYAMKGIFLCGETKDLLQILEDSTRIPYEGPEDLPSLIADRVRNVAESIAASSLEAELKKKHHAYHTFFRNTPDELIKKKYCEFHYFPRRETKKTKKNKKPAFVEELAAAAAAAAAAAQKEQEKKGKEEEEEKKNVQEYKKEEKNYKTKINISEALEEGQRLFQSGQFHQAIVMYNKCLSFNELTDNTNNVKVKCDAQVIQFILGMCKVQGSRAFIFEGLETMQALSQDNSKFHHKPAARYWLAVSFEKICSFKLAQKQAQLCKDSLKKLKNFKPIKWPNTDQPIKCTTAEEFENNCKLLLERLSSARPSPRAKCRHKKCITTQGIEYAKEQIYLADPDFKGYLNVVCEESCVVSYHPCCWKAFKEQRGDNSVNRMSDKDFLGEVCVTPDCNGKISSIQIFDDIGGLKNELLKDKKEKKNMAATGKLKKKKDKKKEKVQTQKKRNRMESTCEDQPTSEETSPVAAENTTLQNTITTTNTTTTTTTTNKNHAKHPDLKPALPIDLESLEKAHVTILKPGTDDPVSPPKSAKKNKKKKTKKPANQPHLLGDPLEDELCVQNEYIGRLRMLRQQRDALEAGELPNPVKPISTCDTQKQPVMLLDPDNPFYLPQHLRDNPEELENVLQDKLTTTSPPGLQQETINTLLDFMYDWLKSEGPMHTNDSRLAEQVADNFPQEAKDYVSQCGGITGLLMQSIKFALIDSIVCVHDDVMKAQEMMCREVSDKMVRSKYLVRYSDGQKAKRYTHLLDDAKSTCSTASSSSHVAGSLAESAVSCLSRNSTRCRTSTGNLCDDHNNNHDNDNDSSGASLAPLSKSIVDQMNKYSGMPLNPAAPAFKPPDINTEDKDEDDEEEEEDKEKEGVQFKSQWNKSDNDYIKKWAARAGEVVLHPFLMAEEEEEWEEIEEEKQEEDEEKQEEDEEKQEEEEEKQEEEEEEEEEEKEEDIVEEEVDEETAENLQDENDEETEQYIIQLMEEKEEMIQSLEKEQQQNQKLHDKLYQVKSQYKSEVMKLKQQLEELKDQNNELTTEKNSILAQKEADLKKYKSDLSRNTDEMKTHQSRLQSVELKSERLQDLTNELQAKYVESLDTNTQLKEELEKMKNLQESLTSCSRRAREAEVKYLSVKKDLVDTSMTRTTARLTEEATAMRQLLPGATDKSVPDRNTLTRTIVAWDEAIKTLLEKQQVFKEESTRLLGMIHQGRPLSALPTGELTVPAIPNLTVAPLISLFKMAAHQHLPLQNNHHKPPPQSLLGIPEPLAKDVARHPSPGPPVPPQVPLLPVPGPLMPPFNGHMFMHNGVGGPPPHHNGLTSSGAIPKNITTAAAATPPTQPPNTTEITCQPQQTDSPNQLFVGQLPWEFTDADVKNLFSRFGEVVSINIYDKGHKANGRSVPKYGFITFRKAEDCSKALSARPIYVRNHMINVQAKEPKKPTNPTSVPATIAGGGGGDEGAGGGGGVASIINEMDATNGTKSSAYGLTDITVNANLEANKSAAAGHHHTMPTTTLHHHHHHQPPPPPPTSQSITKPKFQRLLPTNNNVGVIGAPPPKLVRPQPKTMPNASKTGNQTSAVKEESSMPMSASYTRLIEICKHNFGKEFSSPDICTALREVRTQNSNSLSGLTTEKIVDRVRQQLRSRRPSAGAATVAPWAGITQGSSGKTEPEWQGPSKETVVKEESCSICLEPLNSSPNQSLACLHTFHARCINDWIKIQSNCPNCRKFALMPDEYPKLSHN